MSDDDMKFWYNHGRRMRLTVPVEFVVAVLCLLLIGYLCGKP